MTQEQDHEAELAEARELARRFVTIAERARGDFARATAPIDLPVHLTRAILALEEPLRMREIAEQLACDPSYVTSLADQLEQRGLATRTTGKDRRIKLIALTPEGAETRAEIAAAVNAEARFARQLTKEQRKTLRDLLDLLEQD